jgi:hypothetical protein
MLVHDPTRRQQIAATPRNQPRIAAQPVPHVRDRPVAGYGLSWIDRGRRHDCGDWARRGWYARLLSACVESVETEALITDSQAAVNHT